VCCPFGGAQQGQQNGQNNQQRPPQNNNNNQQRPPQNNNNNQQRPPQNNNNNQQRPPVTQRPPINPQIGGNPGPVGLNHPRINLLPLDSCGASQENRIVNGKRAVLGQFPWMARIGYITSTKPNYFHRI
jgi:hypothetical protein